VILLAEKPMLSLVDRAGETRAGPLSQPASTDTKPVATTAPASGYSTRQRRGIRELRPWIVSELRVQEVLEVRLLAFSRMLALGKTDIAADDSCGRLAPPSQGRQDVLGAAVLAFGQPPLAQLA
jgi:hypothetical protein